MARNQRLSNLVDLAMAPLAMCFGPLAFGMSRLAERAPRSRSMLDRFGVSLVPHHYYEPVVRASDLHKPLNSVRDLPGLDLQPAKQFEFLSELRYKAELLGIPHDRQDGYYYNNNSFGSGDAEILYGIIRRHKPKVFLEIGSGFSTRMARLAIEKNTSEDPDYKCRHICVEPYEQPWLESLGLEVIRERVERLDLSLFAVLQANDILFIDSSHVVRPQGDVVCEYLSLVPTIAPGVLVHVHDIFTPRDYPEAWVLHQRMMWGEQYILESFLSFNSDFEVLCALNWLHNEHADWLAEATPNLCLAPERQPGSFWFRRRLPSPAAN